MESFYWKNRHVFLLEQKVYLNYGMLYLSFYWIVGHNIYLVYLFSLFIGCKLLLDGKDGMKVLDFLDGHFYGLNILFFYFLIWLERWTFLLVGIFDGWKSWNKVLEGWTDAFFGFKKINFLNFWIF